MTKLGKDLIEGMKQALAFERGEITAKVRRVYKKRSKIRRHERAQALLAERAKRSDREQLKLIDQRPGNSAKERARLEARLK